MVGRDAHPYERRAVTKANRAGESRGYGEESAGREGKRVG